MITHKLIRNVCLGMAAEYYEMMARHDLFYARWPDQQAYIQLAWPVFIDEAKKSLATMLSLPSITEHVKAEIAEALIQHHDLQLMGASLNRAQRRAVGYST